MAATGLRVFISHSSADSWVAKQIAVNVERCGAGTFLDAVHIEHGDDFEDRILQAASECAELLPLFTPWSLDRPYVWLEIGAFWAAGKRMVGVLHGVDPKALSTEERIPIALKKLDLVQLNGIDSYFKQLGQRVQRLETRDGGN
jgi:hypothetical protein